MYQCLKSVLINSALVLLLLGVVEFGFRVIYGNEDRHNEPLPVNALGFNLAPYYMFSPAPHSVPATRWVNQFTGESIPAAIVVNDQGFNDRHDFGFMAPYHKTENERVVLLAGSSASFGMGARSAEMNVAGRMEHYLNALQKGRKYTVINLSQGSWLAYQQFIGLELWGTAFHPDWVVSMDGFADAGVGCAQSQGPMNPLFFSAMQSFINAYFGSNQLRPTFYRGWLENQIIRYSVAYRKLTGKNYIPNPTVYDPKVPANSNIDTYRKVIRPTKIGESRQMLAFYLKAQAAMLKLFPEARYILSTQPTVYRFTEYFTDVYADMGSVESHRAAAERRMNELDQHLAANEDKLCNTQTYQPSFVYIFVKGALELERLVEDAAAQGRRVEYHNLGRLFPDEVAERLPFFMDSAHLTERGAEIVGRFYAERVLAVDDNGQPN
jgi:hypothetical protein